MHAVGRGWRSVARPAHGAIDHGSGGSVAGVAQRKRAAVRLELRDGTLASTRTNLAEQLPAFVQVIAPPGQLDVNFHFDGLEGRGVVRASGHGMPCGIDRGLRGLALGRHSNDFAGALCSSGPCYCGVTDRPFAAGSVGSEERRTAICSTP